MFDLMVGRRGLVANRLVGAPHRKQKSLEGTQQRTESADDRVFWLRRLKHCPAQGRRRQSLSDDPLIAAK
jgi:hypothetical protein